MMKPDSNPRLSVFVVDDSPLIRTRLSNMLAALEAVEVVGDAASVKDALSGIAATKPQALILDLQIVGGSGLDVLHSLRNEESKPRVAVLTNWATDQHRNACLAAGAEYVLDKSAEFSRLPQILTQWANAARPTPH